MAWRGGTGKGRRGRDEADCAHGDAWKEREEGREKTRLRGREKNKKKKKKKKRRDRGSHYHASIISIPLGLQITVFILSFLSL